MPRLLPIAGAAVLGLSAGAFLSHFDLPPAPQISTAIKTLKTLKSGGLAFAGVTPVQHLAPLRDQPAGVQVFAPEKVAEGVTFLVSIFDGHLTARLVNQSGDVLHQWPVDFFNLKSDGKTHKYQALIHGAHLYENGDIVANLDGQSIVRVSACGDIVWRNDWPAHHSIDIDENGTIWTPLKGEMRTMARVSGSPVNLDRIGAFDSETGQQIVGIDPVDIFEEAEAEGILTPSRARADDLIHMNDVEVLRSDMADAFPLFEAGDILVNNRNLNQMWVLDGATHLLKWWMTGPMKGAHDPDFQPDGTITTLDNRPTTPASPENGWIGSGGGSRILQIDPVSRHYDTLFETNAGVSFYTSYRGKHQMLDNGNILIAETDAGRAMEVTSEGQLVWQYVNAFDETRVAWLMGAHRYPVSYGAFAASDCAN